MKRKDYLKIAIVGLLILLIMLPTIIICAVQNSKDPLGNINTSYEVLRDGDLITIDGDQILKAWEYKGNTYIFAIEGDTVYEYLMTLGDKDFTPICIGEYTLDEVVEYGIFTYEEVGLKS